MNAMASSAPVADRFDEVLSELRGFGVRLDDIDGKVGLIAEQYGGIKETLESHSKTLAIHTEMIGNLATDVEIIKGDIREMKIELKMKVDRDEFDALDRRVVHLEKKR